MTPPSSGAITGASSAGHTMYDTIRGRSGLATPDIATSRPTGTIIAPPAPCTTRSATRTPRSDAAAQARDARVNSAIAARKTRRAPKRAVSQPLSGISTASVSRYAVMTRPIAVADTPSEAPIRGAAVDTMVPSRFSMKKQPATRSAIPRFRGLIRCRLSITRPDCGPTTFDHKVLVVK